MAQFNFWPWLKRLRNSVPVIPVSDLLDELIVWWSMNDDGNTRVDSHTNGYDLQLRPGHTDPGVVPGKVDDATPMAASQGFWIQKAIAPELDLGAIASSFTIAGWVRPGIANQSNAGIQGDWGSNGVYLMWSFLSPGRLLFGRNGESVSSPNIISTADMVFFIAEYDLDNQTLSLQINNNAPTIVPAIRGTFSAKTDVTIGDYTGSNPGRTDMDEYPIWGRVLTPAQKSELWNNGNGIPYPIPMHPSLALPANGLAFALDGSVASSFYSDMAKTVNSNEGGGIAVWGDLSGNGGDWIQPNPANQFTAELANGRAFANTTSIGAAPDKYMTGPDISGWSEGSFLARVQNPNSDSGGIWGTTTANNASTLNHWNFGGTHFINFGSPTRLSDSTLDTNALVNYENNIASDGTLKVFQNGVERFSGNGGAVGFRSVPVLGCGIRAGAPQFSGNFYFNRFCGYSKEPTPAERIIINAWLTS